MSHSNRAFRLMKSKKAEARRVKRWQRFIESSRTQLVFPPGGPEGVFVRVRVCTSSALRRAWLGLVDGEDLIRTKPASAASVLLFLWRFYALIAKRTHLPRADLNSNTHVCRLLHSLDVISKLFRYHFQFSATIWLAIVWTVKTFVFGHFAAVWMASLWQICSLCLWTHHYKLRNCCLSRTPANLAVSVRSGWAECCLRVITFVGGVLVSPDHWRRACSGVSKPRANAVLVEQPHLAEGGENVGWRGGKVWANVVRTSQPVLDSWGAAQRVTDSEQNHPGAGMKHASAWVWHSSSRGYCCMYGITHALIHFSHHVKEFFRVMMTAALTWQLSCSAWTNGNKTSVQIYPHVCWKLTSGSTQPPPWDCDRSCERRLFA